MMQDDFMKHLASKKSDAAALLSTIVTVAFYPLCGEESREEVLEKINALYLKFVKEKKLDLVKEILDRVTPLADKSFLAVYRSITKKPMEYFAKDQEYLFSYLSLGLKSGAAFWSVLRNVLNLYPDQRDACIAGYVRLMKNYPKLKTDFARYGEKYPDIRSFLEGVSVYEYEQMPVKSQEELLSGYETYVKTEYSDESVQGKVQHIFRKKLNAYLEQRNVKERIREGMYLYQKFASASEISDDEKGILSELFRTVFGASSLKELSASVEKMSLAERMTSHAKELHFSEEAILHAELFLEGARFECIAKDSTNRALLNAVWKPSQSGEYKCLQKELREDFRAEFFEEYFDALLKTVYAFSDGGAKDFSRLIHTYICPFAVLQEAFLKKLTKLLKKDTIETNRYIHFYFEYAFDEKYEFSDLLLNGVLEDYLTSLNKNVREETFAILSDRVKNQARIKAYIGDYRKNHKSIWDKLTGIFSGHKENKESKGDQRHGE